MPASTAPTRNPRRSLVERRRARPNGEQGSLILDILIGMAIFALVAIIAVSAVGQYRMRAYTQAAMSDAEAVANAIQAAITDAASDPTSPAYPTGVLTAADLDGLEVTPTSSGSQASEVTVVPSPANPEVFSVCVEYRGAYAEYLSDEGLIASGDMAEDGFAGCDATFPDDTDGGDGGDGDGDDTDNTVVAAPTGVDVTDPPTGSTEVTIGWTPVPGATEYSVHLDGDTTPAWTGATPPATLTDLPPGEHTATVVATVNGTKSDPSAPIDFTITCDNDNVRCAAPVGIDGPDDTWTSSDYTNANATTETGENADLGSRGMWWTYTAPLSGTVRVTLVADSTGAGPYDDASLFVWQSTATTASAVQTGAKQGDWRTRTTTFQALEGETYKVRAGSVSGYTGKFRLRFESSPANDNVENAATIPAAAESWTSPNTSNVIAGTQARENHDLGQKGLWWTYTPERSGSVRFTLVPTTDGAGPYADASIFVWTSDSTDVTTVQGATKQGDWRTNTTLVQVLAGRTYKIRTGNVLGDQSGPFRLRVQTSPANDNVENAATIPAAAESWTSENTSNVLAGTQAGENHDLGQKGMWWTYTPTRTGSIRLTIVPTTDGAGPYADASIFVWTSASTDIATVQAAPKQGDWRTHTTIVQVVAGQTYKIRTGNVLGDQSGPFRLRMETSPVNDHVSGALAITSLPYTSPDMSNAIATTEPGENGDLSARGLWWTYTAPTSGNLRVSVIAATDGTTLTRPSIYAWDSTATTAAQVQTGTRSGDWSVSAVTIAVTAGKTYKIRVGNVYGDIGKYRVTVNTP